MTRQPEIEDDSRRVCSTRPRRWWPSGSKSFWASWARFSYSWWPTGTARNAADGRGVCPGPFDEQPVFGLWTGARVPWRHVTVRQADAGSCPTTVVPATQSAQMRVDCDEGPAATAIDGPLVFRSVRSAAAAGRVLYRGSAYGVNAACQQLLPSCSHKTVTSEYSAAVQDGGWSGRRRGRIGG